MGARAQAILPLALVVGVLSFLWTEFSLNFTFHWVTSGDLGIGLELPSNFHLILPTAFVSWGMFFMAGGDNAAAGKVAHGVRVGSVALENPIRNVDLIRHAEMGKITPHERR